MRTLKTLTPLLVSAWLATLGSSQAKQGAPLSDKSAKSVGELIVSSVVSQAPERTLNFPGEHSMGSLSLVDAHHPDTAARHVAVAKGKLTVSVPKGWLLMLELNRFALDHPDLIAKSSQHGIDCIKAAKFSAMDSNENGCDDLLKCVPHFKDAILIDVDRSDATDAGLSYLSALPKLRCIRATISATHGGFLKDLASCRQLESLDLSYTPLYRANLAYLARYPKLRLLSLAGVELGEESLKSIAQCKHVEDLCLFRAQNVSDKCVKYLASMSNLQFLDIEATAISARGVQELAPLKLKWLRLPGGVYSAAQRAQFQRLFPKAELNYPDRHIDSDYKALFAPTLRNGK